MREMETAHGSGWPKVSAIGMGAYSLFDAAYLLHIPYRKLRRWAAGYWYSAADEERFSQPVVPGESDDLADRVLSFPELMELFVIGFFRGQGVSMAVVRAARASAQRLFQTEYPFAVESLETDGRGIFATIGPELSDELPSRTLTVELARGQIAFDELVRPFFRDLLAFERGLAYQYWPLGKSRPVLLDAHRSFGRPILDSSGVPTFAIYQMQNAGEERARIAAWYDISGEDVDAAVEYERGLGTAA